MIRRTFPTVLAAWKGAYLGMLDDRVSPNGDPYIDYYQRNIISSYGNVLTATAGTFDFDLGEIGLTITKWTKFTNMYVDIPALHAWVNNAMNVKSYEAMFPFKITPPQFFGKKAVHQWGPCILGISFRRNPKPATLTFYTRTQSLGFSGVADYALIHFITKQLAKRMGVQQESIQVRIYATSFIMKMVETVHTLTRWGLIDQYSEADNRIGESIRYYMKYMTNDAPELRWRSANRMRTKWRRAQADEFTSLPTDSLTLRGWDFATSNNVRRTSRETQTFVLQHRAGEAPVQKRRSGLLVPASVHPETPEPTEVAE